MAQLRYRLRPTVPANGNAHDQRGAECPLRLHGPVGEGIRFALSTSGLITDDPDDAGIKCLPHWLVEGLLSRVENELLRRFHGLQMLGKIERQLAQAALGCLCWQGRRWGSSGTGSWWWPRVGCASEI